MKWGVALFQSTFFVLKPDLDRAHSRCAPPKIVHTRLTERPGRRSDTQIAGALCKLGVELLAEGTMFLFFFSKIDINCE